MKAFHLALLMSITSALLRAEDVGPFVEGLRDPDDIANLPKQVTGAPGRLTLMADFAAAKPHELVPVYVINRTTASVLLRAQDGDPYLKLETLAADGTWKRAQGQKWAWCGNSFDFEPTIQPGHFLRLEGYQPRTGKPARVRYQMYLQDVTLPASNEGLALADAKEVVGASSDVMAVKTGSLEFVRKVALEDVDEPGSLQTLAMEVLGSGRFDEAGALKVLDQVVTKYPAQREEADRMKARLKKRAEFKSATFEFVTQAAMARASGETDRTDVAFSRYLAIQTLGSGRFNIDSALKVLEQMPDGFPDSVEKEHARNRLMNLWDDERQAAVAKWRDAQKFGQDEKTAPPH